jgi:predicted amidophosphoribosyltransferase
MIKIPTPEQDDRIHALGDYHPYKICGDRNPCFDARSGWLLDLKKEDHPNHKNAIAQFSRELIDFLPQVIDKKHAVLAGVIPSHEKGQYSKALASILQGAAKKYTNITVQAELVERTKTITKLASGGDRSLATQLASLRVNADKMKKGVTVILLDDITTTGNSIKASKLLVQKAGATEVIPVVLGKTTWP